MVADVLGHAEHDRALFELPPDPRDDKELTDLTVDQEPVFEVEPGFVVDQLVERAPGWADVFGVQQVEQIFDAHGVAAGAPTQPLELGVPGQLVGLEHPVPTPEARELLGLGERGLALAQGLCHAHVVGYIEGQAAHLVLLNEAAVAANQSATLQEAIFKCLERTCKIKSWPLALAYERLATEELTAERAVLYAADTVADKDQRLVRESFQLLVDMPADDTESLETPSPSVHWDQDLMASDNDAPVAPFTTKRSAPVANASARCEGYTVKTITLTCWFT